MLCLLLLASASARAQRPSISLMAGELALSEFTHGEEAPAPVTPSSIGGTVKDSSEINVAGAKVTLVTDHPAEAQTTESDAEGRFSFPGVVAGPYKLTVEMPGFRAWTTSGFVQRGQTLTISDVALSVMPVNAEVEVVASSHDVAEAQLGFEEKQRVLGVFPNYYTSYIWDADPLTRRQKFALAWRFSADPTSFAMAGAVAGAEQWQNGFSGYGHGTLGYAKRFGATYADGFVSTLIGQAILPSVFHQDPRYFLKGTGSIPSRALYAMATAVICKGDNRHWQVNYSNILGNVASAGLSNLYYPASSRQGAALTVENSLVSTAMGAVGGLVQEFLVRRMTPNLPDYGTVTQ